MLSVTIIINIKESNNLIQKVLPSSVQVTPKVCMNQFNSQFQISLLLFFIILSITYRKEIVYNEYNYGYYTYFFVLANLLLSINFISKIMEIRDILREQVNADDYIKLMG